MSTSFSVRASSAPPGGARGLIRWVCTKNPFYVLSAGLFLAGLYVSFSDPAKAEDTWAMMAGLASYTLLLAVTACLLVRFARVWDDVRTVLLLVVLMFLATSVTFDEVLALHPGRGYVCYLGGLLFAVVVSEAVLRGIRLKLPAWYRVPYYLILALFFLYPLALSPLLARPRSEVLQWGLFGFSTAAGLVFLTLLPAVRRGAAYVRDNGSPWPWPLYPWALFGVLGFAVPGRAFLLCWSMQLLDGPERFQMIFGPYFVVPFGLAVAVLLLEFGLVSHRPDALAAALLLPAGLAALATMGHRPDPIYQDFLNLFTERLHGGPLFLTLLAGIGFYVYAALRRVSWAAEALTAALVALAFVGPHTVDARQLIEPRPLPIVAAATLQLLLGLWRQAAWRCLLGAGGLVAVAALALPLATPLRELAVFHLALFVLLLIGAVFNDTVGRLLRMAGAALALLAGLLALALPFELPAVIPPWTVEAYPLLMAGLLAAYGLWLGDRPSLAAAGLVLTGWLGTVVLRGYWSLRQIIAGLDYLVLSLTLFVLAILISLAKAGLLSRRLTPRRGEATEASG